MSRLFWEEMDINKKKTAGLQKYAPPVRSNCFDKIMFGSTAWMVWMHIDVLTWMHGKVQNLKRYNWYPAQPEYDFMRI